MVRGQKTRVLIVDDEKSMRELLAIALEPDGHHVRAVASVADARRVMDDESFDVIVSDIAMPGESGLDLLAEIRQRDADLPVILITAYASMEAAKQAFNLGVYDCIDKGASFSVEAFRITVHNAVDARQKGRENQLLSKENTILNQENLRLKRQLGKVPGPGSLVQASPPMRALVELIERVAPTNSTILITGESGTGKEVVARTIHHASLRAEAPFVSINCGALPSSLLESELFGHVKGAFTGAVAAKDGLFEVARGGTIFLDEIGDMPPEAQMRLLRVLQEKTIRRVGGTEEISVDARVLAATNADLATKVANRSFREDLFYRINVIPMSLPALRERREDIAVLAETFAQRFAEENNQPVPTFAPETMLALESHSWPGNVRELENAVLRALTLTTSSVVPLEALPPEVFGAPVEAESAGASTDGQLPEGCRLEDYLDSIKGSMMRRALQESNYVQVEAARRLGMSFRSFRYFAKQLRLDVHPPNGQARTESKQ